jgi:imidazolonepropionase-like amidohydrolase
MALLVESGLTPREALRSATLAPAQFLGIADKTGSVTVGKRADLVLLEADPAQTSAIPGGSMRY